MKIQKINKEKFKNWTIFLFFLVGSVLNSCSNFLSFDENRTDENKTAAQDDKCIITVSSDFYSNDGSRAAFPDFLLSPDTLYFAEISYTSGSSKKWLGEDSVSETAVVLKNNYSDVIRFVFCAPQETSVYTLALYACPKQTGSQVSAVKKSAFAQGDAAFELSAGQKVLSSTLNIKLKPQESSGKGKVDLPILFDSALGIVAAKVNVTKDGAPDSSGNNYGFKIKVSGSGARLSAENVPTGIYLAIMKFRNNTTEVAVNSAVQHISVYSEMTTNLWFIGGKKHGTAAADGTFKPSALELTKYDFTELYVCGKDGESDGKRSFYVSSNFGSSVLNAIDTDGDGSMAKPFETVQKAVDTIAASGDTTKKYTIYVDGTVEPTYADTDLSDETFISIKGTTPSNLDLTIKGLSAVSKAVLNAKQNTGNGGRVLTSKDTSLTLENLKITGGKVNDCGGIYIISGNLTLKNCVVTKNESSNCGGGIHFDGENLIVENSEISENKGDSGGICVAASSAKTKIKDSDIIKNSARSGGGGLDLVGESTIEDCNITDNKAEYSTGGGGGLILASNNKSCKIINSVISNNTAGENGGGIYINGGTLSLETGAAIRENTAETDGGGIYIRNGSLNLESGAAISNNTAKKDGGAIYASCEYSTITVNIGEKDDSDDVLIEQNKAKRGGAFYGADNARFVMNAGKVSENYSTRTDEGDGGGAMFLWGGGSNYSTFTMNGGEIIGNMAKNGGAGGAVHIDHGTGGNAAFIMTGGLLSGNKTTDENGNDSKLGGAIYVKNGGQIKLGGSAVIEVEDDRNDIWLADRKTITVTVTGTLTPGNNVKYTARITPETYNVGTSLITADSGVTLKDEVGKFCVTGNAVSDEWFITTEGKLSKPAAISDFSNVPDFNKYPRLTVSSGDEMKTLAAWVKAKNTMEGYLITQTADITLPDTFTGVGVYNMSPSVTNYVFSGTFDGKGHKITSSGTKTVSIFNNLQNGGGIKNVISEGKFLYAGIAYYCNNGIIENCENNATISGSDSIGGIVGKLGTGATISNCINKGDIEASSKGGGICGWSVNGSNSILNCINLGSVTGTGTLGAVVATNSGNVKNTYYLIGTAAQAIGGSSVASDVAAQFDTNLKTTNTLTVEGTTSNNLIDLLNAWVSANNSSGAEQYFIWDRGADGKPALVY